MSTTRVVGWGGSTPPRNPYAVSGAKAVGDWAELDTDGSAIIYADTSTHRVLGLFEPLDNLGTAYGGFVSTPYLDAQGAGANGAGGPIAVGLKQFVQELEANTIVEAPAKGDANFAAFVTGAPIGITGTTGAQVIDTAATNKVGIVEEVILAPTSTVAGIVRVRILDASLSSGA